MNQSQAGPAVGTAYLRYALALLFCANVVNFIDRSVIGVLIEPMRAELHLSDTQIGVLTGFAFALFYGTVGIFVAHLADLYSRPLIISLSVLGWSIMAALTGTAQSFWQLLLARVGVGIGEAGLVPAANALLADSYKPERRPFALALFTAGSMIGIMAGSMLGGAIGASFGWRWAFIATGLAGLPLALIVWLTLRDPGRGASDGAAATPVGFAAAMRLIVRNRVLLLLILSYAFMVFMVFGVIGWFPAFLVRQHSLSLTQVGVQFGTALGIGTAAGGILGGMIANRLAARDMTWLTRLPLISMFLLWPLYEAAIFAPSAAASLALITLVAAVGGASLGPALSAMQLSLPPAIRAKGAALNGFIGSLIGIGGGPLLVGMISDHYSSTLGSAASLQRGLAVAVCVGAVGVVFMLAAHRALKQMLAGDSGQETRSAILTR